VARPRDGNRRLGYWGPERAESIWQALTINRSIDQSINFIVWSCLAVQTGRFEFELRGINTSSPRRAAAIVKVYIHPAALPRHATTYQVW
jgi:hypothetical protein